MKHMVPVLWRRRLLVDAAHLPIFIASESGAVPFIALDAERDGSIQIAALTGNHYGQFIDPMFELGRYDAALRARVVRALALSRWSAEANHCAACGRPLHWDDTGAAKRCDDPVRPHRQFPRIDPATIVLVEDGERVLLGRSAGWPAGLYSTLAGFVEVGETAEEAVAREVFEEAGVRVNDIRYFGSEPWPFPRSLMIGFYAAAETTTLTCGDELEDVRWFDVTQLRELQHALACNLPHGDSIARRLIAGWLAARE